MTSMKEYHDSAVSILEEHVSDCDGFLWTGGKEAQVIADMLIRKVDRQVKFLTVDTGNHLDSVVDFRNEFASENDIEWEKRCYEELYDVLHDPNDPRGYHGEWNGDVGEIEHDIAGVPDKEEEWDVSASCGSMKVVPLREFIREDGYDKLITGIRGDDPLMDSGEMNETVEMREPAHHTRVNPLHNWDERHVWAYIKREFVDYPDCYNEGYRHTDSVCCIDNNEVGEHGEGGRDPEKMEKMDELHDIGYI